MSDAKTARERLREALSAMDVTVTEHGVGYTDRAGELAKALHAAHDLLSEPEPPVADGAALLRELLDIAKRGERWHQGTDDPRAQGAREAYAGMANDILAAMQRAPAPQPATDGAALLRELEREVRRRNETLLDQMVRPGPYIAGKADGYAAVLHLLKPLLAAPPSEPRPADRCEFCFGVLDGSDTDGHGLGECVPVCPTCDGSGIADAADMTLSEAVKRAGFEFVVDAAPGLCRDVLGKPEPDAEAAALKGHRIAAKADSWDHAYAVAHEIAEVVWEFRHCAELWMMQANVLAAWHRLRAGFASDPALPVVGREPRPAATEADIPASPERGEPGTTSTADRPDTKAGPSATAEADGRQIDALGDADLTDAEQSVWDWCNDTLGLSRENGEELARRLVGLRGPQVCCDQFATCERPCVPRDRWLEARDRNHSPDAGKMVAPEPERADALPEDVLRRHFEWHRRQVVAFYEERVRNAHDPKLVEPLRDNALRELDQIAAYLRSLPPLLRELGDLREEHSDKGFSLFMQDLDNMRLERDEARAECETLRADVLRATKHVRRVRALVCGDKADTVFPWPEEWMLDTYGAVANVVRRAEAAEAKLYATLNGMFGSELRERAEAAERERDDAKAAAIAAFVFGSAWQRYNLTEFTQSASENDEAEAEARKRYPFIPRVHMLRMDELEKENDDLRAKLAAAEHDAEQLRGKAELHREKAEGDAQSVRAELRLRTRRPTMGNEVMSPVPENDPLMVAWRAYEATESYTNTKRWAGNPLHVDGSLWAAFMAGYCAQPPAGDAALLRELRNEFARTRDAIASYAGPSDYSNGREAAWSAAVEHIDDLLARAATPAAAEPEPAPALREAAEAIASWTMAGDSDGQQVTVNVDAWDEWLRRRAALRAALGRSS